MSELKNTDVEVYNAIKGEEQRESEKIVLIASENYVSDAVLEAQGSVFTNKYAEGYPHRRYYGGCEYADAVESLAIERAKKIFGRSISTSSLTQVRRPTWPFTSACFSRATPSSA